jgi:hypothetical protein
MMEFEACNSPSKVQYDQQKAFEHFTRKTKRIQNLHHEGGSGKINIANERQTRKMQDKDMVEVCRYKVCWLGKKERKFPT